jgi:hypothetical protein
MPALANKQTWAMMGGGRAANTARLRGRDLALVILVVLAVGLVQVAAAGRNDKGGEPPRLTFHIPAQPLASALQAYSEASGVQVLYESRLAIGIRSANLDGELTAEAALQTLLAGTGLTVHYTRSNAITIAPKAASADEPPPRLSLGAAADLALDPLRVSPTDLVPDQSDLAEYTAIVQTDIQNVLRRSAKTRSGNYRVGVKLWVAGSRMVERVELFSSTGDRERDAAISDVLHGLAISAAAPANVAQPVRVVITVRSQ